MFQFHFCPHKLVVFNNLGCREDQSLTVLVPFPAVDGSVINSTKEQDHRPGITHLPRSITGRKPNPSPGLIYSAKLRY